VVVAVVTDEQVFAVLDGDYRGPRGARPGSTVVIVSTVAPSTVARVAEWPAPAASPWSIAG
jgi:3-hydroxyisobutyrate dehydrogenase-like beta-hydroxyacid dehydrogenase